LNLQPVVENQVGDGDHQEACAPATHQFLRSYKEKRTAMKKKVVKRYPKKGRKKA